MMDGFGQQAAATDQQVLEHLVQMLTDEQASATAVGATESAAKAIAATRGTQITQLQGFLKSWYPSATVGTGVASGTKTIEELRQELLHHSQLMEGIQSQQSLEHPELSAWIATTLASRATEVTTLYSK